jgi:hypothetical protein
VPVVFQRTNLESRVVALVSNAHVQQENQGVDRRKVSHVRGTKWKKAADGLAERMQYHAFQCQDHVRETARDHKDECPFCADTAAYQDYVTAMLPPI